MYKWGWVWKKGLQILFLILLAHIVIGVYAVYDQGEFIFGVTAIERFVIHSLRQEDVRYTISGSPKYFIQDFCVQECPSCPLNCYPLENVHIVCEEKCIIKSARGLILISEGEEIEAVAIRATLVEQPTLLCQRKDIEKPKCVLRQPMSEKLFYDRELPEGILVLD
ncbi:hypothetical protein ACFLRC_04385 [Candidatus Altiarchaeota archaeon]